MKQAVIKDLSLEDLREKTAEEKAMYRKLKMNHAVSPVENPMKIRSTRKVVARLMTELNRRLRDEKSKTEKAN